MIAAGYLVNFIWAGVAMLLVTIPMHWIRHRTFQAEGVKSNTRGFCVFLTLLIWALWITVAVMSESPLQAGLNAAFLGTLFWMAEIDARTRLLPDLSNLFLCLFL